jgi:hypothetical protein
MYAHFFYIVQNLKIIDEFMAHLIQGLDMYITTSACGFTTDGTDINRLLRQKMRIALTTISLALYALKK